jgi:hypothetical protein
MFGGLFILIYLPFLLVRAAFMVLRALGIILMLLARFALRNQQRKQQRNAGQIQHVRIKLRRQQYPTFNNGKSKVFI